MTNKKHIIKLEYDEKNNLILKEQEIAGNKNSKFEYEYDGQNRLIKFKVKILHNNKESVEIINYNKKVDISKINKINLNNDKEEIVYKYRYDKKENWIERLEYVNGVCENTIIRYFTYF